MVAARGMLAEAGLGRKRSLQIQRIVFDVFEVSVRVVLVTGGKYVKKHSERSCT